MPVMQGTYVDVIALLQNIKRNYDNGLARLSGMLMLLCSFTTRINTDYILWG